MSPYIPKTMIGRAGLKAWNKVGKCDTSLQDAEDILRFIRTPDMNLCMAVGNDIGIAPAVVDLCWTHMIDAIVAQVPDEEQAQAEHGAEEAS